MWKVLQVIVLFATVGFVLATRVFHALHIEVNALLVVAVGLGITTLLMYRSLASMLVIVLFGILVSLPDATLNHYNLDRDMLLAFAIAVLCLPWIQRFTGGR